DPLQAEGDGAGGGGAGGTIILNTTTVTGAVTAQAIGAAGSNSSNGVNDCTGPGGGGGGGIVWTSGASVPAAISPSVGGGANGVVSSGSSSTAGCVGSSNGATSGAAGISQAGYVLPFSGASVCVVLASPLVSYFTGSVVDQGSLLSWGLTSSATMAGVTEFTLERSVDHLRFTVVADVPSSGDQLRYTYTDPSSPPGTTFYRLSWVDKDRVRSYSPVVALSRPMTAVDGAITLYPNPATDQLSIRLLSTTHEPVMMRVFNAQGQELAAYASPLHVGANLLSLPVRRLAPGAYFLSVEFGGRRQVRSFLVRN
ncbi:MAG: T9SS type A sorting domain-containing protein, partial [Bacteroidota bacterium]|nr:T9SS type A sorting domain-containing protein [Bacteroidota bacterium]